MMALYAPAVATFGFEDDGVLVKALAARDPAAFEFLLDRYHNALVHLAGNYVPSRAIAEEVAQETWLAVITGIDRFEGRSSIKTWLFRIMLNIARTRGVKEQRSIPFASVAEVSDVDPAVDPSRFRRFRHAGAWKHPPDPWPDPERQVIAAEQLAAARDAIAKLPGAQREVITMRDLLGWNATEVCDALGVSEANQRVLLHRARSKLRGVLEQRMAGGER
jgi:RNA polymerase sigma-70 factor (ECF subfamily)